MSAIAAPGAPGSRTASTELRRVYLSAGERSGDEYLADLATALAEGRDTQLVGMAGPRGRAAGIETHVRAESLTALGFAEIVQTVPAHMAALFRTHRVLRAAPCDVAVLVDYPGYHLRVARVAQRFRVPTLQYVAPQLWAWGPGRIAAWRAAVEHCAVILPFEKEYFDARGLSTTFVGHPLLDRFRRLDRATAREAGGLSREGPVLALFPGSRPQEIRRLWPPFREAARRLAGDIPDLEVVVACTDAGWLGPLDGVRVIADPETAMAAADAVLCKSGTSTLLAAMCGTPMVVAYRAHPWSYALARRLVTVPRIALVNVIGKREIVPELLQDAVTPESLVARVRPLFRDHAAREKQLRGFEDVVPQLGTAGVAWRVAALAADLARRSGPRG